MKKKLKGYEVIYYPDNTSYISRFENKPKDTDTIKYKRKKLFDI